MLRKGLFSWLAGVTKYFLSRKKKKNQNTGKFKLNEAFDYMTLYVNSYTIKWQIH